MKNIAVFGSQQITIGCLEILKKNKSCNIAAVIGCEKPDDKNYNYPSIKEYCKSNNFLFFQPVKLNDDFLNMFKSWNIDIAFSIFYRNIFSQNFISIPKMGLINIHPSLLPKYRGPVPSLWAMLNNETETGITIHYVNDGIDTGDIIKQIPYKIPFDITGYELNNQLMKMGIKIFNDQLPLILMGRCKRIKQDHSKATYFGPFNQNLRKICWYLPSQSIINQILAFTKPYSGAVTYISGMQVIIWKASKRKLSKRKLNGPGKIIKVLNNNHFIISTVDGFLLIEDYEIKGVPKNLNYKYIKPGNKLNEPKV